MKGDRMSIRKITPYLNYPGTASKAIKLYESALGAKVENVSRFGDIPGQNTPPELKDRVMHALLQIGEATVMISDTMPDHPYTPGTNIHVALDFTDAADMGRRFEALSAGGKVTMPLQDTFWGAKFGMLVDAHGVNWMFNCEVKKP
jgi:PhnB protein